MDQKWDFRPTNRVELTDLGPLPDVVESNSETTWRMFSELQAQQSSQFLKTQPSGLAPLDEPAAASEGFLTVDELMFEVRRHNRVCPAEQQWRLLSTMLQEFGADAPRAPAGPEFRRTPSLAKRTLLREQVVWAAHHGALGEVFTFLKSLPESQWVHIGD